MFQVVFEGGYVFKNSVNKIESLTDELNRILNTMNGIVEDNVNNPTVWKGEAASSYKQKWDKITKKHFLYYNQ